MERFGVVTSFKTHKIILLIKHFFCLTSYCYRKHSIRVRARAQIG